MIQNEHVNINKIWAGWAPLILVILTLFFSVSLFRNISSYLTAREKLAEAQARFDQETTQNRELIDKLALVETTVHKETIVRDKLGLAREGETVFILPDDDTLKKLSPRNIASEEEKLPDSNWRKWLKLFI